MQKERRKKEKSRGTTTGWVAVASDPNLLVYGVLSFLPRILPTSPSRLIHPSHFPFPFPLLYREQHPLLVNLTFLSDRYPRVYPDLSSLPVCWSFNTTAVALRNWHNLDSCGTFWKGKESNRLFEDSIISWIRQLFEGKINELPREETFPFRLWNSNLTSFFLPSFFNAMNSWNALCIEKRRVFVHNVYSQLFPS